MSKLVLIDGNAILHRAYHALPPLTTKKGEPINAVYGLVSMLLKVIQDLKPTHIAIAFDRKEPTFRHEEFPAYQAQRPAMEDNLSSQFEKAKDTIGSFGIPIYEKAGYEADDVIGTLALKATSHTGNHGNSKKSTQENTGKVDDVVIVTGDRDILQLVTDKVKVYMPIRGLKDTQLMGEEEVVEKMGVKPSQIDDFKALVGDPSDNYPGVAGIGPKTAVKLLNEYDNLDNIYKHLNEIPAQTKAKLEKGKKDANISKRLATIITDVPIIFDIELMAKWDIDNQNVLDLFSSFGFKTLTERVKKVGKELDEEKQMKLI